MGLAPPPLGAPVVRGSWMAVQLTTVYGASLAARSAIGAGAIIRGTAHWCTCAAVLVGVAHARARAK